MREELCNLVDQPHGPLRQQPRRRRALPGAAPDLRLRQDRLIWDTGHQIYPHKLITGRYRRVQHDPHQGRPDGLPQPAREPLRPVHDRPRRLQLSTALGLKIGDDLLGPARAAQRRGHRRRRVSLGHRLRGAEQRRRPEEEAAGHPQRQQDVDLPAGRRPGRLPRPAADDPSYTGLKSEVRQAS